MIGIHKTSKNKEIPIIAIEDGHLINIIRQKILSPIQKYNNQVGMDEDLLVLIGQQKAKPVKPDVKMLCNNAIHYIAEGLRRDTTRPNVLKVLGEINKYLGDPCRLKRLEDDYYPDEDIHSYQDLG